MKQGMKVRETGTLGRECREIRILHGTFVVRVFEHDEQHAVEMVSLGASGGTGSFFLLACFRFGDLGLS